MRKKDTTDNKKRKKRRLIILSVVFLVLLLIFAMGYLGYRKGAELLAEAKDAKHNAEDALHLLRSKDFDGSQEKLNSAHSTLKHLRSIAESEKIYKIGCKLPKYGDDFKSACTLMDIADDTISQWSGRCYDLLRDHPIDGIISDEGYDVRTVLAYLTFAEEAVPVFEKLLSDVSSVKLSFFDIEGKISEYRDKIDELLGLYHQVEYYFPLLHAALGDGSDRTFLLAAQNTAEIRPCGGFPGSMGTITIKDGMLSIGSFISVWSVFPANTPSYLMPEASVNNLFNGFFIWPRDAEFCPDFEYLGQFWADMYEHQYGVKLSGIISMTPAIIQDILNVFGELEVSSGDVINGSNAVKLLQHDWYIRYMNAYEIGKGLDNQDKICNALFEETAKGTISLISDNLDLDKIPKLFEIIEHSADERVFMLWLRGEKEEELVRQYGYSGGLSKDQEHPEIGVFFGNDYGSKLGWWIDIDTQIGEGRALSDGRMEYDVTVKVTNNFNTADIYSMGYWIVGKRMTAVLSSYLYLFAPAGGTISNLVFDYWKPGSYSSFSGLQVGYVLQHYTNPGSSTVATFTVTTAPGVTEKPTVYKTPTLTEYRQ